MPRRRCWARSSGAAMVYLLFSPVIDHYNALHHLSRSLDGGAAGVFFTHPGSGASRRSTPFVDEIVLTGILVLGIFAITEEFNTLAPAANSGALIIGLAGRRPSAPPPDTWRPGPSTRRVISDRGCSVSSPDGARRPSPRPRITGGCRSPARCSAVSPAAALYQPARSGRSYPRAGRRESGQCAEEPRHDPSPRTFSPSIKARPRRAASCSSDQAQPLPSAQREFQQHYPAAGWVEHDAEDIWRDTLATCARSLADRGSVPATSPPSASPTSARPWWYGIARTGVPIHRAIVWQDRRTAEVCAKLEGDGAETWCRQKTGLLLDPYFSGTKLRLDARQRAGRAGRAERGELAFGTIDSFLLWRLTGGRTSRHRCDQRRRARCCSTFTVSNGTRSCCG